MTEKQKERVAALLVTAEKCEEGGIRVGLNDGAAYRLEIVKDQKALRFDSVSEMRLALENDGATLYVSDGERLWKEPRMVLELDIFSPEIVTRRYYFKGVKKVWGIEATGPRSLYDMRPECLPNLMEPAEVVIYDHTRQAKGRAAREVLE